MIIEKKISYPVISLNNVEKNIENKSIILKINNDTGIYNVHRALINQIAHSKQKNAHTKTRSEVRGGGKKPWKQKGSGRARAGSSRSPLWRGGGVSFGPKFRRVNVKINQKEKHLALRNILYNKFKNTLIVENLTDNLDKPKTKQIINRIKYLYSEMNIDTKILIIVNQKNHNFYLSTRNLPNIQVIHANQINVLALLKADILIITPNAIDTINETYNGQNK